MKECYISVVEEEHDEPIELPIDDEGFLEIATLSAQFPGACGLKYRSPESNNLRGLRVIDGKIIPPDQVWTNHIYIASFPKVEKRKADEQFNPMAKKKLDTMKCSDLIVLGLPWKSDENDLRKYFGQFGDILMVQVKMDLKTNTSKGFGFVRFADYKAQLKCLSQRHMIDGRWCDVRIPNSKDGEGQQLNPKVFVGRCTAETSPDDLREFFSQFGEVVDVYIPKPFRSFAFVTFADPFVAASICGEDYIINNASVHVSNASPKNNQKDKQKVQAGWGNPPGPNNQSPAPNMNQPMNCPPINPAMMAAAFSQVGWNFMNSMAANASNPDPANNQSMNSYTNPNQPGPPPNYWGWNQNNDANNQPPNNNWNQNRTNAGWQ